MIGAAVGTVCGVGLLLSLMQIVDAVCTGRKIPLLYAALQPLLMLAGLLPCALFVPGQLLFAGTAMAAVLIFGAVARGLWRLYGARKGRTEQRKEEEARP